MMNSFTFGKSINIILKPTNACNMRCTYCYHSEKGYDKNKMSIDLFETICNIVFPHYEYITLIWHGGEPMLMGLDFYIQVCNIVDNYQKIYGNKSIKMIFQTNALLMNHEWIAFFKKHHIHVGTSFDGTLNELTRGNTENILNIFNLMHYENFPISAISVVTSQTLPYIVNDYMFYKDHNINIKFNPVFKTNLTLTNNGILMTADNFTEKMIEFLNVWYYDVKCNISVEPFMDFCLMAIKKSRSCTYDSCLLSWLCIDCEGNITPCGRNFPQTYCMGNVYNYKNIQESFQSEGYIKILDGSIKRRAYCKEKCSIFNKCHGGCSNDALLNGDITKPDAFYCQFTKEMLRHLEGLLSNNSLMNNNINPYIQKILASI